MCVIITFLLIWFSYPWRDIVLLSQFSPNSVMLCPLLPKWFWWLVSDAFVSWEDSSFSSLWDNLQNLSYRWWFPFKKVLGSEAVERWGYNPKVWKILSWAFNPLSFQIFFVVTNTRNNLCHLLSSISFLYLFSISITFSSYVSTNSYISHFLLYYFNLHTKVM